MPEVADSDAPDSIFTFPSVLVVVERVAFETPIRSAFPDILSPAPLCSTTEPPAEPLPALRLTAPLASPPALEPALSWIPPADWVSDEPDFTEMSPDCPPVACPVETWIAPVG